VTTGVDCRYRGQSHELTVPSIDAFDDAHRRRNGYARPGAAVDVVAIRATARVPAALTPADLGPPPARREGTPSGPVVLAEADCTVWLPDGWHASVAPDGSWVLTR
jgi:5-oxoprolinase (ATP-hydrolysing)